MINRENDLIEEFRPLLTVYSYNILGTWEEAKDIVQDALLKFTLIDTSHISDKKSYLIKTVINLSLNQKKKNKLINNYPGQWLPEPVITENAETSIYRKEILSYSLMVLLEKLTIKQRAVFILKEAFDYDHDEIAEVLSISSDNSRQLLARARKQLHDKLFSLPQQKTQSEYSLAYLKAIQEGNVQELERLFNEEISITSDGGGKAKVAMNILYGKKSSIAFLIGVYNKVYSKIHMEQRWVNHQPAFFYFDEGKLTNCQIFSIENDQIVSVFFIRNPDKLKYLK